MTASQASERQLALSAEGEAGRGLAERILE